MSKVWHENFKKYMEYIVANENYKGLPIERKNDGDLRWVATGKSKIGLERKKWAEDKAISLGLTIEPGVYAKTMFEIHPTKEKACQICGEYMSIKYLYPNASFIKRLEREFGYDFDSLTRLDDIINSILLTNDENKVSDFLKKTFKLNSKVSDIDELINLAEEKCRSGSSKLLGPGAMSNFPDRYDGFHTYNRCCRSTEDKGRWTENMRSYNKDRRAYEYWSDGNLRAANQFMNSNYFTGSSADHMGPISLGFIHDSLVLRRMSTGDNSAKRDRLLFDDIVEMIKVENNNNISIMSWYSELIWEHIKNNFRNHDDHLDVYRNALKINMANLMYILNEIITKTKNGEIFLINNFINPKLEDFKYDYSFSNLGEIESKKRRNITESSKQEKERFVRVSFDSVIDYNDKENRNTKPSLTKNEIVLIDELLLMIDNHEKESIKSFYKIMNEIQNALINRLKKRGM